MLHLVETQRVYRPETIAAMTAAFDQLCESIPRSVKFSPEIGREQILITSLLN